MLNRSFLVGCGVGGGAAHRYWRVRNTASCTLGGGAYNFNCVEALWNDASGIDLSTGGTPLYSSQSGSYLATYTYDGKYGATAGILEFWGSASTGLNEWIGYDFGTPVAPSELRFMVWSNGEFGVCTQVPSIEIDYSDNGTDWYPHKAFSGLLWSAWTFNNFSL